MAKLTEEDKLKKKNQSKGLKIKKFLASKVAANKLGQKVIFNVLGSQGEEIVRAMKHAAVKYTNDKKRGKYMKTAVLKLALKATILFDSGALNQQNTMRCVDPINSVCLQLLDYLKMKAGGVDPTPLCSNINRIKSVLVDIMSPHIQQKNINLLKEVLGFYADYEFMYKFLNQPEFKEEKDSLSTNLDELVAPLLRQLALKQGHIVRQCNKVHCRLPRAKPEGKFAGSEYCPQHHYMKIQRLLKKPKLLDFLRRPKRATFFVEFLQEQTDSKTSMNAYHLYTDIDKWRQLGRKLRGNRANVIFNKFMAKGAPQKMEGLEEKHVAEIESKLDDPINSALFNAIQEHVLKILTKLFKEEFLKHKIWINYKSSVQLGEELEKKVLADIEKEKKRIEALEEKKDK